jgi:hypothetical protein
LPEEKEPKWVIPGRDGIEVFVNNSKSVTIKQDCGPFVSEEADFVVVHPDDIPALITMLESARAEALRSE